MTHVPTTTDIASDLRRCIYASLSKKGFGDKMSIECWESALKALNSIETHLPKDKANTIKVLLNKNRKSKQKRREDILTASILLLN